MSDSISWTFRCDERIYLQTFCLRLKELRNSLKVLEIYALLSIWYCYLHNFFPCSFHIILVVEELMVEVNSFDVRRGSLIIFLFLLNHKELYWLEIRDFHIEIIFVQLIIVMHRSSERTPVVIHSFFCSCRNAFLIILNTQQIKNSVVWALRSKATDLVCCYANYVRN